MTDIHATPVIDNKFWIVERDGQRFATLRKDEENRFIMSNQAGIQIYNNKKDITREFGDEFFIAKILKESNNNLPNEIHGFPTKSNSYNSMYDIKRKLPLFTKSNDSKSLYCAGYYIINFNKGWTKAFCPKLITLQRYPYQGPFRSETAMKQVLSHVSK